jgi:hypothetical protein
MNSVSLDVGVVDCANQMEVNRVPTQLEGLTTVVELDVLNSSHKVLHAVRVHHDVCAILILV